MIKRRSEARLLQLALLMVSLLLLVMAVTSYILYNGAMEHERRVLLESVEDQRYFIEAFGHGAASGPMKDEMLLQLLAPVIEAQRRVETQSRVTEMLLGKRLEDGRIWLLINPKHLQDAEGLLTQEEGRVFIPSGSSLAIPMQRALNGEEGTITAVDYRGREVVAAYTSVRIFAERFGLVAKVERSRIYDHLIQMAWKVGGVSVVLLLAAMLLFKRIAFPLIRDLRERLREYRKLLHEHETTRRELVSREQQLRSLIENLPGGAFRYDVDAEKIVFVSEQIEELTGCSCEDFYENSPACLFELLGEETFRRRAQALDALMNNTPYVLDYPITKRNGKTIWIREQGHQIYDPAKKIHWLDAVIYDITLEKLTQEQLSRRVEEGISKLRDKDEMLLHNARLAAMGEMVGMIAHQWRQPISVIGMIANNMLLDIELDTFDAARSRDELNQINDEVQYLSQTIEDFTGFFKPKSEREVCTLGDLVDDTLKIIGKSLANNDIEVIGSVDRDHRVEVYRSEMVQVLLNLFKNAQDIFKEEGRRDGKVFIESYPEEERMVLAVEDNGGGIAEEVIPKVFEPYFSTKHTQNGTGVGLYMSKMIVEEHHNGTIRVRNNGNGARFEVVI